MFAFIVGDNAYSVVLKVQVKAVMDRVWVLATTIIVLVDQATVAAAQNRHTKV
jgi:hypothetical protein